MTMQIADSVPLSAPDARARAHAAAARDNLRTEPRAVRIAIIALAMIFLTVFVVLPLVVVFAQAFSKGILAYFAALAEPEALAAIKLTLLVAAISVGLNLVFGLVAAWAIAKFDFSGKTFLITLIDLPFSVSPVISGLVFVLLFGAQGYFGGWLRDHDIQILFAVPGIALATGFALAFARGAGEYGSVIFIAGNVPFKSEIAPLLIITQLEEYSYAGAAAIACVMLLISFAVLLLLNLLQHWQQRRVG